MATSPQLDILVIAHNNIELSIRCVKAICRNTSSPFHLIMVDDSTDLTPTYFTQFAREHNNFTYFHSDASYDSSYPVIDEALRHCQTPYMALVVNSVIVEPDWEIAALQLMKASPEIAIVGMKCLAYPSGLIESAGLVPTRDAAMLMDIGRGQPSHRYSKVYECVAVQWAFVLLRTSAVRGHFETQLYHGWKGWEEFETCFQLRDEGWRIFFCGLGVGYHQSLATREVTKPEDVRLNLENREIFAKRWGFWRDYHQYASYLGEFFPELKVRDYDLRLKKQVTKDSYAAESAIAAEVVA